MEQIFPYVLNIVAILIALFGVYVSATRDYEHEKDKSESLQRRLEDCARENDRLRDRLELHRDPVAWGRYVQQSGIHVSGESVNIDVGRDMVGGDSTQIGGGKNTPEQKAKE